MKHLPKIFLLVSVAMFTASLTSVGSDIHYGALKPLSAILFIVFFILQVTQKEVAHFDEEHAKNIAAAQLKRSARIANDEQVRAKRPLSAFAN